MDSLLVVERVSVVWRGGRPRHHFPSIHSRIGSRALTLLNSVKAVRGEEAVEERLAARGGARGGHLHATKAPGEAARSPEDLPETVHKGGYSKQQVFKAEKEPSVGRRRHLGLPLLERS